VSGGRRERRPGPLVGAGENDPAGPGCGRAGRLRGGQ